MTDRHCPRKIAIVGAGVSGLAAGVMLLRRGYAVDIYERNPSPGGLAACWNRKGYHVEGAVHWMIGCYPGSLTYPIWKEAGALQDNNPPAREDPPLTLLREGKEPLCWYRDLQRTEAHLLAEAPDDEAAIRRLVADVRLYRGLSQLKRGITLRSLMSAWRLIRMSAAEYADRFRDADLRALICSVISPYHNAFSMMYVLGAFAAGEGGYPEGGGERLIRNMTDTFVGLGGRLHLSAEVERIVLRDGRATGLLVGGKEHPSDAVLVASDTRTAIDRLFPQPLTSRWAQKLRERTHPNEVMLVALGVRARLDHLPHTMRFRLSRPFNVAGQHFYVLPVYNYAAVSGYAPEGCTTLTVLLFGPSYDYWKRAKADGSYRSKKQQVADAVSALIAQLIPETEGRIEMTDVATPVTYERYCSTFAGSLMNSWMAGRWPLLVPARCRGIKGVYFSGQRTLISGGLPIAVISAKNAVARLAKDI